MAARAIAHSGAEASADKAATPFMAFSRNRVFRDEQAVTAGQAQDAVGRRRFVRDDRQCRQAFTSALCHEQLLSQRRFFQKSARLAKVG
jgi:hypothetical protein